jgi:hypothetical protein
MEVGVAFDDVLSVEEKTASLSHSANAAFLLGERLEFSMI